MLLRRRDVGSAVGAVVDRDDGEPIGAVDRLTSPRRAGVIPSRPCPMLRRLRRPQGGGGRLPSHIRAWPLGHCPVQAFRVSALFATQFHPELDVEGMLSAHRRVQDHGYFAPETADSLKDAARQRKVDYPMRTFGTFARRYAR